MEAENFLDTINPHSLTIIQGAKTEPAASAEAGTVSATTLSIPTARQTNPSSTAPSNCATASNKQI